MDDKITHCFKLGVNCYKELIIAEHAFLLKMVVCALFSTKVVLYNFLFVFKVMLYAMHQVLDSMVTTRKERHDGILSPMLMS